MFIVIRYLNWDRTLSLAVGPFSTRHDAERYALDNCQIFGWDIAVLMPADAKVQS